MTKRHFYNFAQAARRLGTSLGRVKKAVRRGALKTKRVDGATKIPASSVEKLQIARSKEDDLKSTESGSPEQYHDVISPTEAEVHQYSFSDDNLHRSPFYHLLSTRTRNCLETADIRSVEALRMRNPEDLLSIRSFGAKCLGEVETFLSRHLQRESGTTVQTPPTISHTNFSRPDGFEDLLPLLVQWPHTRRRLRRWAAPEIDLALDVIGRCQEKVESQVSDGRLDDQAPLEWTYLQDIARLVSPPAITLSDLLFWAQYLVSTRTIGSYAIVNIDKALDAPTLDAEVAAVMSQVGERTVRVLRGRFAAEKKTLAVLGEEMEVSRERVRQLESEGIKKLQQSYFDLPLPRIRTAMARVRACSTFSREEIREKLFEYSLAKHDATVNDFLLIWQAMRHHAQPFPEEILNFAETGFTRVQREISGKVMRSALRQLRMLGVINIDDIASDIGEARYSTQDVVAVLKKSTLREIALGFWGTSDKRYAVHRVAEKMVTVCGPLHVGHLHVGTLRHQQRFGRSAPPPNILRAALDLHEAFLVDSKDMVHLRELGLGAMPSNAEYTWLQAIDSFGPVVHVSTIYRMLANGNFNSGLADYLTKYSELVQPIGESLYCLPGTQFRDSDIEAGHAQASKEWINRYLDKS